MNDSRDDAALKALEVDRKIDCRGELCPGPVLKAMEALGSIDAGAVVVMTTDVEAAVQNVRIAVETGGLARALGVVEEDGLFHLYMKKS